MFLMLVETLKCVQKLPRSKLRFIFLLHCYSLQFCQQTKDLNMTAHVGCISQDLILTLVLVFYRPLNKWRKMNEEIQNEWRSSWSSVGIALHSSQIPGKCGHECFFPVDVLWWGRTIFLSRSSFSLSWIPVKKIACFILIYFKVFILYMIRTTVQLKARITFSLDHGPVFGPVSYL